MFRGVIYFAGAKSRWLGKVHRDEVIKEFTAPWLWAARWLTLSFYRSLDQSRCGYALLRDDVCIEQFDPQITE